MLDVIAYVSHEDTSVEPISRLVGLTEAKIRLLLILDGGRRAIYRNIEHFLRDTETERIVTHNIQPVGWDDSVRHAIEDVESKIYVAIGGVSINDRLWLSKIMQPFVDQTAGLSIVSTGVDQTDPWKLTKKAKVPPQCRLFAAKRLLVGKQSLSVVEDLRDKLTSLGNCSWMVSKIRTVSA